MDFHLLKNNRDGKRIKKAKARKVEYLAARYENKRTELREAANKGDWDAMMALQKLPKTLWLYANIIDANLQVDLEDI